MLYTIEPKALLKNFDDADQKALTVLGRKTDNTGDLIYKGRVVWNSKEAAKNFTSENIILFGVDADWKNDTVTVEDEDYRRLNKNSTLVKI